MLLQPLARAPSDEVQRHQAAQGVRHNGCWPPSIAGHRTLYQLRQISEVPFLQQETGFSWHVHHCHLCQCTSAREFYRYLSHCIPTVRAMHWLMRRYHRNDTSSRHLTLYGSAIDRQVYVLIKSINSGTATAGAQVIGLT